MLSNLIMLKSDEMEILNNNSDPLEVFENKDIKGIDTVKLAKIQSNLLKIDYKVSLDKFNLLFSSEESWFFSVPNDFVEKLSKLDSNLITELAEDCNDIEEFKLDNWKFEKVKKTLVAIVNFSKAAIKKNKILVLRITT
ncbi:MAG: hypothetical protein SFU98_06945 [Leptospiraceae bacterium]|nr:hypothetical protein [Leptospiraceae bacterium]